MKLNSEQGLLWNGYVNSLMTTTLKVKPAQP
jgi:hypothetical protein